jgi:Tfp pilus assembly protein PilN
MIIRLNLATQPIESNRRFAVGATTIGTLGLIAMLFLSWHAYAAWRADKAFRADETRLEGEMNALQAERGALEQFFNQPAITQRRDRAAFLNSLIAQRAFPWTRIFMDLEQSLPEGVRVVSIEPRLVGDHLELRLVIGSLNDEVKLKFLRALEGSSDFSAIEVLNEGRSERATDTDRIVLSIQARYSAG